jgi:oligopeptide/dipeptide ABC transporter ATP-binding protein
MGKTDEVFDQPLHPYTKALFASVPKPIPGRVKSIPALSGEIGDPFSLPSGCRFNPRCDKTVMNCPEKRPTLREVRPGHYVSCHRVEGLFSQKGHS